MSCCEEPMRVKTVTKHHKVERRVKDSPPLVCLCAKKRGSNSGRLVDIKINLKNWPEGA